MPFWQRYVKSNPEDSVGRWEILITTLYLRHQDGEVAKTYSDFRAEFDRHIAYIGAENAALPWDRLGHWAQDDEDWVEAERCFRKAYELAGGEYGYCLAIALMELKRFDESVPLLLVQAEKVQPDALSWFNLAFAYCNLHRWQEAVEAYQRSLALDPDYALAIFELGGAHWNRGDAAMAAKVWATAMKRFPDHELSAKLRRDFSSLFKDSLVNQPADCSR